MRHPPWSRGNPLEEVSELTFLCLLSTSGFFTCEVRDYNQVENKSIGVDVIVPPSVEVNTLSATVIYNAPLSLNCLSPEDTRGLFKYAWFRGEKPLDPEENEEVVEDLVPTGARLTMKAARASSNYSCVVSNQAGDSRVTIVVYVVSSKSNAACAEITCIPQ